MTHRYTADTITDDELDRLYYRLDRARDAVALHRRGLLTTAELYAVIEADAPWVPCPACRRADQAGLAASEQHDDCAKEQQ
ncbi:hypothetical protein [Streptomyces triticiradicis]|uniref:Uncharacterized protein n=1 Tax=Streptomyces triticiradicis TaxID=2651189 RepID=A0A7J5D502_9ACTN|nr:hypothetical protein [Streptomyces triticiradicis]KAB1979245.1 hypothetical protein F8144_36385 [Streptomyces triticiradicis]